MYFLPAEIWVMIINHSSLRNKDSLCLLITCKNLYCLGNFWKIKGFVNLQKNDFHHKYYHNLVHIVIKECFDIYPRSLKSIEFDYTFNQLLVEKLPDVRSLQFGDYFDQPIHYLPTNLKYLTFGLCFNRSLNNVLPTHLKYLELGCYFNQPLDLSHLSHLKHLIFGQHFNQSIDHCLPSQLKHLELGCYFNQPIKVLPSGLKYLQFGDNFNQPIHCFPDALKDLEFGWDFNQPIHRLPATLKYLRFGCHFNQSLDGVMLGNLQYLEVGLHFNQVLNMDDLVNTEFFKDGVYPVSHRFYGLFH